MEIKFTCANMDLGCYMKCKRRRLRLLGLQLIIVSIIFSTFVYLSFRRLGVFQRKHLTESNIEVNDIRRNLPEGNNIFSEATLSDEFHLSLNNTESDIWSGSPGLKNGTISMKNCPVDWPLEVLRREGEDGAIQLAQVCRKQNGTGEWKCASGWRAQIGNSNCVYTGILLRSTEVLEGPDGNGSLQVFWQMSDKHQIIFVHLPHTGGTSIENSNLFDDSAKIRNISDLDEDRFKNYRKFSIVRHPCSRLISAWKYLTQESADIGDKSWAARYKVSLTSFNDFVMTALFPGGPVHIENQVHLRTQISMLFDDKKQFRLDQLLVYERWNESMAKLGNILHKDTTKLLSSYTSSGKICKEMYTNSTWLKMTQIYKMDFCVLGYSRVMDQINSFPSLIGSQESLSNRFQNCMRSNKENLQSEKQLLAAKLMKEKESCIIYTYYQKQSNIAEKDIKEHSDTINVWKRTWSEAGWTPYVLSEDEAKTHPEYDKLHEKFFALPTVNRKEYEMACFLRHVAMAAVGGGWMSDYDVIPLHIPTCVEPLNGGRYTVYEHYTPSLVSGSGEEFTRVSKMMANIDWRGNPRLLEHDRPHVSDMHLFNLFVKNSSVESMLVVIGARDLFAEPFACNRTWSYIDSTIKPIPPRFTQLPWVIHFAHASFGTWREKNVSSLWPGSPWNAVTLRHSSVRPTVMGEAFDFLRSTCKLV
ncbi:hypothetical protein HOLleu_40205 [Holothuria leucospilota]|uniref:Uncharacterized protein n=1 Tax=Holothuria leucospilota TaxID=206669 RepID=A0A9Q0YFG8_HOLLE|nr:hypothetical protein HOLleu_40205 [Holothuria leucospilota]